MRTPRWVLTSVASAFVELSAGISWVPVDRWNGIVAQGTSSAASKVGFMLICGSLPCG